jgi:precorrin-2 dehydrogenase / sirohydrochlorin ferrochelatase
MAESAPLYPISLVVAAEPCLVVGGGPIGARKVRGLLDCDAAVTVIAPEVAPSITALGEAQSGRALRVLRRPYRRGDARGFRLVLTATGIAGVDRMVAEDARSAGIWVNSADDAEHCSFLLPAVVRDGAVNIAVSTSGASPALAGWLRDQIARDFGTDAGALAAILDRARRQLRAQGRPTNSVDWVELLDAGLWDLVRGGRLGEASAILDAAIAADP